MDASNWIAVGGVASGAVAFLVGLYRYNAGQRWKRAEFVAAQVKDFGASAFVRNALLMLDWTDYGVPLLPDGGVVYVTDAKLCSALEPHRDHRGGHGPIADEPGHFEEDEAAIRSCFDEFLDYLERFEHFIDAGLVDSDGFRPYLEYWINLRLTPPADPNDAVHSARFFDTIRRYIDEYRYTGVTRLIERFKRYRDRTPTSPRARVPAGAPGD